MKHLSRHHALLFMLLCLLVAAALRLPALTTTPPGPHYDEAANGLLSGNIGFQGDRPLFIDSYTGKEVLFFYLAGGMMRLVGNSLFALRLTAVFVGLLTIATTYWLGREMRIDRHIALIAAALLAVSFWHIVFSRLGFRAITQPLLQALTIAALLRGVRRNQPRWLAVAGLFLGLTAYTYLAARLFPILLLFTLLPLLINRNDIRQRAGQLLLVGGIAFLVLAPLLYYFITHPDAFWVRISQVAPDSNSLGLGESLLKSFGMIFLTGDPYWRFNLPERPLFDWFWGGLLVVGWIASLWRLRLVPLDWQRSTLLLFILTPIVMILPTALAVNEIVPSNLRAMGLIPFVFYLPAIGLITLLSDVFKSDRLSAVYGTPSLTVSTLTLGGLLLVAGGAYTGQLYFNTWGQEPYLFYESDGDLALAAEFLQATDTTGQRIFVAALHYQHPTVAFLTDKYPQVDWLVNSNALVFPNNDPALYLFPHNSPVQSWMDPFLETAVSLPTIGGPDGEPAFTAYRLNMAPAVPTPNPVDANFSYSITLLGYEVQPAAAGSSIPLLLYWRVDQPPGANFAPYVHLEDSRGDRWSQVETVAYPSAQWQRGDRIIQRVDVPLLPGTPPGSYRLRVGLFIADNQQRLSLVDESGRYAGDSFFINNVPVMAGPPPDDLPRPPFPISQQVRDGLTLLGYQRGSHQVNTGDTYGLRLWWLATQPQPELTTRLELRRADNTGRILLNTQPVYDSYPFSTWQAPLFLIDPIAAPIPVSLPPGEYQLVIRILNDGRDTLFTTELGNLTVLTTERLYSPPDMDYPLAATFSQEIKLLGYNLTAETGELALVWQTVSEPAANYTVFVHLLNQDGSCCVWQQDSMPQQGQYPTTRWLPDEVVVDPYQMTLPDNLTKGEYVLEVGLYIAETGQRVQVTQPGLPENDVVYLRPLTIR